MEVRKVGQSGEIICTSVLRAVNRSQCEEAPSSSYRRHRTRQTNSNPNGSDGNKGNATTRKLHLWETLE